MMEGLAAWADGVRGRLQTMIQQLPWQPHPYCMREGIKTEGDGGMETEREEMVCSKVANGAISEISAFG